MKDILSLFVGKYQGIGCICTRESGIMRASTARIRINERYVAYATFSWTCGRYGPSTELEQVKMEKDIESGTNRDEYISNAYLPLISNLALRPIGSRKGDYCGDHSKEKREPSDDGVETDKGI